MDGPHDRSTDDDAPAKKHKMHRPGIGHNETEFIDEHELGPRGVHISWVDFHHGEEQGDAVARGVRWCELVHELLSEEMKARWVVEVDVGGHGGEEYWREAMEGYFEKMDEEVRGRGGVEASKAVFMVIGDKEIVVACRGDSISVLYRGHIALGLSCHSRSEPDDGPNKQSSSNPSVRITNRRDEDRFVVIASNSLWDVMSDEVACWIVGRCLEGERGEDAMGNLGATKAAMVLAGLAMACGSKYNIRWFSC